jgi:hypothetical protein
MSLTDWIISSLGATIAILIAIVAYFAQKWIQQVDETLKEQSGDIRNVSTQIISLKSEQGLTAENISKAVQTHLQSSKFSHIQFDRIEKEVSLIKNVVQEKLLPQAEKTNVELGRVIVLETQLREQENKLVTLFSAVKALAVVQKQQK